MFSLLLVAVLKKIALDAAISPPGLLLFFLTVGGLEGHSWQEVQDGIRRNFWPTQIMSWKVCHGFYSVLCTRWDLASPCARAFMTSGCSYGR